MNAASPHDCLTIAAAARRVGVSASEFRAWATARRIVVTLPMRARGEDRERVWWGDVERELRATVAAPVEAVDTGRPRRRLAG